MATRKPRKPMSAAARAKLSARLRGKKHPHKGHALSAAARAKISARLTGKHHKGHALSASARAKISAALKGKPHKGHALSAETRAKISAALRARHPTPRSRKPGTVQPPKRRSVGGVKRTRAVSVKRSPFRLISSATRHRRHNITAQRRRHRSNIVIHRRVRAHRVWRRRKR